MIRTENLNIGYRKSLLTVDDFNLKEGKLYFLIGKNGSGKSTFLKTISGQLSPISGSVFLQNKQSIEIPFGELPKTVSFVSSHFPLVDFLRVEEFIALGRSFYTSYSGRLQNIDNESINHSFSRLKIEHLRGRFTSQLSDGEKQLVAIAKALVQETPIILLDEPTAFLDYSNKILVLEMLKSIAKEMNKCIILSSHDIDMSLEMESDFLAVNFEEKFLQLIDSSANKQDLLRISFE
ncbi:MAG TPA: ABC transporter ATP-binding protein [Crocinitomicaceae bacterium]|nr:ABC transporter ATP-binding protein [Crocinitomicaceae bacterium]